MNEAYRRYHVWSQRLLDIERKPLMSQDNENLFAQSSDGWSRKLSISLGVNVIVNDDGLKSKPEGADFIPLAIRKSLDLCTTKIHKNVFPLLCCAPQNFQFNSNKLPSSSVSERQLTCMISLRPAHSRIESDKLIWELTQVQRKPSHTLAVDLFSGARNMCG